MRTMLGLLAVALAASLFAQEPEAPAGSVVGQVVDALGEPVLLADVWVSKTFDGEAIASTKTDGSGMFSIGRLPEGGILFLRATATGKTEAFDHIEPNPSATAWMQLWDAGAIVGRVIDAAGNAIAGAEVIASYDDARVFGFGDVRSTTTDDDGRYELTKVPLGAIDLRAVAAGCVLGSARLSLRDREERDLVLQKGEGVRLTVRVEGVRPQELRHARVEQYASGMHLPRQLSGGPLDANGVWTRSGCPDVDYTIYVNDDVLVFKPRSQTSKQGTEVRNIVFTAMRPATVRLHGKLLDPAGKPLPNETFLLRAASGGREARVVTGAEGGFELQSPLAPGEPFIAWLTRSDWVVAQAKTESHSGDDDMRFWSWYEGVVDPQTAIELRAEPEVRVRGRVLDAGGEPVPFARVEFEHARDNRRPRWMTFAWSRPADRDGRFQFEGVRAFADDVRLRVDGLRGVGESEPFRLQVGEEVRDLELRLAPPAIVEGTVRDAQGAPVAGARVWLRDWDFASGQQQSGKVVEVLTDQQGRYRHVGVAPGGHYLELLSDGREKAARTEPFEVAPGQRVQRDL